MVIKRLLQPGSLIKGRQRKRELYLWHSCDSSEVESSTKISSDDILVILETRNNINESLQVLMPEWKHGAYLVMSSQGQKGWLGEGWVIPIEKV